MDVEMAALVGPKPNLRTHLDRQKMLAKVRTVHDATQRTRRTSTIWLTKMSRFSPPFPTLPSLFGV